jgi:hypothetical protein
MATRPTPAKYLKLAQPGERRLSIIDERIRHGELTPQQQKVIENTATALLVAEGQTLVEAQTVKRVNQIARYANREWYETQRSFDDVARLPLSQRGKAELAAFTGAVEELAGNVILGTIADYGDAMRENLRRDIYAKEKQPHVEIEEQDVEVGFRDALRGSKKVRTQRIVYDD